MFDENGTAVNLMALNNAMMAAAAAANGTHPSIASNHPVSSGQLVNQLLTTKDSRWLQLEVCREFQRGQCSRTDEDCKFAHPPPYVDIQNGRVTACYDSIKGRCTRDNPKCKYLHPPQHLKDQLLMNGKQHLAMKSLLCAQLTSSPSGVVANGYSTALPQLVHPQPHPLISSVPMQYFSQLPSASLYPPLLGAANGGPALQQGAGAAAQSPSPLSTATLQQLLLFQQQLQQQQQQQQQQAAAAAALSANTGVQPNPALLVALALQQQQAQAQMAASLSAGAGQLGALDVSQQSASLAAASRKRTAQVAGISTEEALSGGKQSVLGHAESERRERASTHAHPKDVGGSQSPNPNNTSPASNSGAPVVTGGAAAAAMSLLAFQQQQQQLQHLQQCQLLGLVAQTPTPSSSSTSAASNGAVSAIAPHLSMKRSAGGDKNGVGIMANGAMYAAQATPLNPYLLQQIPAGYLQFNGQHIPPRY